MNDASSMRGALIDGQLVGLLKRGGMVRGIFNPLPCPAIVEMTAFAGFDFVIIDNEHGNANLETTENMLRAARASGIPAIVRCLPGDIARTLDIGANGIQIPMVNDAQTAREIVERARYPLPGAPIGRTGHRGSAFSTRAAGFGAFGGPGHVSRSNESIAVVVQVETPDAIDNIADIAGVPGISAVFIGTNDLAHSMGFGNRYWEEPVERLIRTAIEALSQAGIPCGIPAFSEEEERKYRGWGADYFAMGTTGLIMQAFKDAAGRKKPV